LPQEGLAWAPSWSNAIRGSPTPNVRSPWPGRTNAWRSPRWRPPGASPAGAASGCECRTAASSNSSTASYTTSGASTFL